VAITRFTSLLNVCESFGFLSSARQDMITTDRFPMDLPPLRISLSLSSQRPLELLSLAPDAWLAIALPLPPSSYALPPKMKL
jgi:hypothetical protein